MSRITPPVAKSIYAAQGISTSAAIARPSDRLDGYARHITRATHKLSDRKADSSKPKPVDCPGSYDLTSSHSTSSRPTSSSNSATIKKPRPLMQGFQTSAPKYTVRKSSTVDYVFLPDIPEPSAQRTKILENASRRPEISIAATHPNCVGPAPITEAGHSSAHDSDVTDWREDYKLSLPAPFSALIISLIFVIYFLIRFYILEGFLLKSLYAKVYTQMDETTRRGFVNHHIAGSTKILILISAAYPFIHVAFGNATFHTPFAGCKFVTQGDVLIMAAQVLIAILNLVRERDATIEFILCTVWGAFDIVSEFLPHVTIILYRVYPTARKFLRKLFRLACITTLAGTIAETILTMYLFASLWPPWTLVFKVTTPMLHVLFASAQLWGSWVFYNMYKKQGRILATKTGAAEDVEAAVKTDVVKNGQMVVVSRDDPSLGRLEIELRAHSMRTLSI
ncbi:hypothetical protein B0J14DRAFT_706607 [Halenospora varia]|nr:hypothetical protein B0J14DRAFT_706607 [Halenospora varia]